MCWLVVEKSELSTGVHWLSLPSYFGFCVFVLVPPVRNQVYATYRLTLSQSSQCEVALQTTELTHWGEELIFSAWTSIPVLAPCCLWL